MTPALATLLLSAATFAAAVMADEPVPAAATALQAIDQRMEAYDQFKAMFETARFEEALPLAQRVVELSEIDRDRDTELPIAYNNLGATQYQLGNYQAAEASYQKSLALLEESQGISSRRMITPLAGLGAVYAALDQHALAVQQFDRALAVSRRSEGLFNLAQLPVIEQAANSRFALGDYGGVERDHFYALRIAEQKYGYDDSRTLPALMRLASFYESVAEFAAARGLYLRVRDISMKESGGFNSLAVKSLLAIGRTHRMQFTLEPRSPSGTDPQRDPVTGDPLGAAYQIRRAPTPVGHPGLKSIELALQMLRATPDPPRMLLAETLTELGDWYQATSRASTAMPYYAEASIIYAAEIETGMGNPLLTPRMISYRPPLAAKRGIGVDASEVVERRAVFSLVVGESGDTQNVTVVTTDMSDGQLAQSRRALERAVYSPRFENGKPVATEAVQFTSKWYEQRKPETPSTTG
jgi:tetratricopeptide (TPR) repeat protein